MRQREPYPFYKNTNVVKEERRRRRKRALPASDEVSDGEVQREGLGRSSGNHRLLPSPTMKGSLSSPSFAASPLDNSRSVGRARRKNQNLRGSHSLLSSSSSSLGNVLPVLFDERNIPESLIPPDSLVRANAPGSSVWPLASILAQPGYNAAPQGHVDVESVKRWVHFMNTRVEQGSGRVLPEDAVEDLQSIQYMGFHELVRQVMVSNFERGEALLELWRMKTELDDLGKQELKKKISTLEAKVRQRALSKESKTETSQRPAPTRKSFRPSHRVSIFDHATIARVDMQRFSEINAPKMQSFDAKKNANETTRASTAGPHDSRRKSSILPIFERFFLDLESELPDQSTQSTLSLNPDEHLRSKALYKDLCEALEKVHELEEENERLRLTGHT